MVRLVFEMSRRDRRRRLARKKRKVREVEARAKADAEYAEQRRLNPTPVNESRLRQIFLNLSFRSHEKGGTKPFEDYVFGPTVTASTPQELEEATNEFYVREALKQKPS